MHEFAIADGCFKASETLLGIETNATDTKQILSSSKLQSL